MFVLELIKETPGTTVMYCIVSLQVYRQWSEWTQ